MKNIKILFLSFLVCGFSYAQVGIGTTNPDPSSMLDITSDSQGLLAPRMDTADRNAIANPAEGLLVFDTDEDAFYYYDTTGSTWIKIQANNVERDNYKLVKSEADLSDEFDGTKYTLQPNFLYEINGQIDLQGPIDLNTAYVSGRDANEDILARASGDVFAGNTGGSIRNVTISSGTNSASGTAFNITGPGTPTSSLLIQNTIIANKAEVGTISGLGLFFGNIVQFVGNTDGITYTDIDKLLLNNQAWLSNNGGVYETLSGDFNLIQKVSGFSQVVGAIAAVDVTGITNISGDAVMKSVVFSGGGNYVNGNSPYTGYNFTTDWTVDCPGIQRESDDVAGGNFYYNGDLTTGFAQTISSGTAVKVLGNGSTTANSLFRFTAPTDNRLTYQGTKTRNFQINASLSVRVNGGGGDFYAFVIAKDGVLITESNSIVYIPNSTNIQSVSINAIVSMTPGEYIEIYTQRLTGNGGSNTDVLTVFSENLSIN